MTDVQSARPVLAAHSRLLSSALLVAGLSMVTGALAVAREGVTARYFGRGDEIEAFVIGALVPMFLINAFGNSIGAGFVPTLLRVEHDQGQRAASDLISSFMAVLIGLVAIATAIAAVAVPLAIPRVATGFAPAKVELAQRLFFTLLPVFPIGAIGRFWLALLNGYERFAAGVLAPAIVPATVIAFIVAAPPDARFDALVWGVACGFVLQFLLALQLARRAGIARWPRLRVASPNQLSVASSQYFPQLAGIFTLMLLEVVESAFAAPLGPGAVAGVNYASKLAVFVLGFAGSALATAVVPYYARLRSEGGGASAPTFLRFGEVTALGVGAAMGATVAICAVPIVAFVFQGGRFDSGDTAFVARLVTIFVLAAPAYLVGVFYGRLLLVEGRSRSLLAGAALSIVCAVLCNLALVPLLGAHAIPMATALAYVASALWLRVRLGACLRERHNLRKST
jgi:putative peptidoglycan lipid II flippase